MESKESKEDVFPTWKSRICVAVSGRYLCANPNGRVSWISGDDQKDDTLWAFHRLEDGRFNIINVAGAADGQSYMASTTQGAQIWLKDNWSLRKWTIEKLSNGLYNIRILSGVKSFTSYLGCEGDGTKASTSYCRMLYTNCLASELKLDVPLINVSFKLDEGKVLSNTPAVIAQSTLPNTTSVEQSMSFSVTKSVTEESTFEKSAGVSLTVGTSFECGIPFVSNGEVSLELTASGSWTWGEAKSISTEVQATFPVVVPPNKQIECKAVLTKSKLTVPYVLTFGDGSTETGTWFGVSAWNLREELTESDLNAAEAQVNETKVKGNEVKENDEN